MLIAIGIIFYALPAHAQFFKRKHALPYEHPPEAILVQLPTETNRIAYFIKKGKSNKVQALEDASKKVISATVSDFRDNFSFCPVYFFYDSSIAEVKEHHFAGAVYDKNMQPVQNIGLSPNDTEYFIVYYGMEAPVEEPENARKDPYNTSYTGSAIPNLIALSHDFKKLPPSLPDKPRYNHFSTNIYVPKYYFEEKEFNILYTQLANYYSRTLEKYNTPKKH